MIHVPVLQKEVLEILKPGPNQNFIDCTIGEGGHALAILEKTAPDGKILGIDWNQEMIKSLKFKVESPAPERSSVLDQSRTVPLKAELVRGLKLSRRLILVCDNFVNLKEIVEKENFQNVQGILLDLGISSWHLEKSGRGFSFQTDEPLDMRYNIMTFGQSSEKYYGLTAEKILNEWSEKEIEKILKEYGEERFARRISKKITEERKVKPIKTTFQLVEIIKKAVPAWYQHKKLHFTTRTFQALRIAVNDELENLKKVLPQALEILEKNGRLVMIAFHSLEDRIVKNFLKENFQKGLLKILTKKPLRPSIEEIKINPRSRSAKLRAAIKL